MQTDLARPLTAGPIQPEIPRSRFARGMLRRERIPEELRLGRFSDGQQTASTAERELHRGRFSQGQERTGDEDPEKHIRRRYSEGLETARSTPPPSRGKPGAISRLSLDGGRVCKTALQWLHAGSGRRRAWLCFWLRTGAALSVERARPGLARRSCAAAGVVARPSLRMAGRCVRAATCAKGGRVVVTAGRQGAGRRSSSPSTPLRAGRDFFLVATPGAGKTLAACQRPRLRRRSR